MFYHYSALFVCNGRAVVAFSLSLVCLFEHAYELERNILICFFFFIVALIVSYQNHSLGTRFSAFLAGKQERLSLLSTFFFPKLAIRSA